MREFAAEYQRGLAALDGLDLVPLPWLHLTMQNVGFTDEVDEADANAVLARARHVCSGLPPFQLTFGDAEIRDEGVALRPFPPEPVARLRDTLRGAIERVRGTVPEAPEHAHGFEPHVSLAYSNREAPSGPVARVVEAVRASPVIVTVLAAKLIVLDRDERVYRWSTFGLVGLDGGA